MIEVQNQKAAQVILPQSVGTTAVTGTVDTLGADYVTIEWNMDTAAATSVPTTMKIEEGDTTSAWTAVSTGGGSGDDDFTMPTPNTSTGDIVRHNINLVSRKRYLRVSLASTTARLANVNASLSRKKESPASASEAGLAALVNIA